MNKKAVLSGAILVMLAILLGAFGAHGLKKIVTLDRVESFEAGVRYQFYAGFSLLIIGLSALKFQFKTTVFLRLMLVGVALFSGSIYLLSLQDYLQVNMKFLGPITPIGGLLMILSWAWLIVKVAKQPANH